MHAFIRWLLATQFILLGLAATSPTVSFANAADASATYLSPRPGARFVQPQTTIIFRPGAEVLSSAVTTDLFEVTGSQSGLHHGTALLAEDNRTVIFRPTEPFSFGEAVTVVIHSGLRTRAGTLIGERRYSFSVMEPRVETRSTSYAWPGDRASPEHLSASPEVESPASNGLLTLPVGFPAMTATVTDTTASGSYFFLAPFGIGVTTTNYLTIVDGSGALVYYQPATTGIDFKVQPDGTLTYYDTLDNRFHVLDSTYTEIGTYQAGNGYVTDVHELQVLPNGHALLMIYDDQSVDMSAIDPGGRPDAIVTGLVLQELDTNDNVVFEWRSWDHFAITDTLIDLTTPVVDYVHGNAIEVDADGNWLISSRHLSEITKIDRQSGDIIWRMGGKNNQFTFTNEAAPYFNFQHDIRRLANGHLTIFDNRNGLVPAYSRAVEYLVDENTLTVSRVWEYRENPDVYGFAMGNAQRLPNDDTVIGWGMAGRVTEVRLDGSKVFEMLLASPFVTYRAFRSTWIGHPISPPTLVVQDLGGVRTIAYSWNGATEVASYQLYGGTGPNPQTLIDAPARTSFETQTILSGTAAGCYYYKVVPISRSGEALTASDEVTNCPYVHHLMWIAHQ